MAAYQQKVAQYYNSPIRNKEFKAGDPILCQAEVSQPIKCEKLSLKWEGPYQVDEVIRLKAYYLKQLEGTSLPRPWNLKNLRIYYQ